MIECPQFFAEDILLDLYQNWLRPLLFLLPPELAHSVSCLSLQYLPKTCWPVVPDHPVSVMGLSFRNPVGLAAGMDKNADYIDGFAKLGFGCIEVGGVTPLPQPGNPRPRLFRLPEAQALINRFNFNSKGVDYVARRLERHSYTGVLGANITKNDQTPLSLAAQDYEICMDALYPLVSYFTINVSCPNNEKVQALQQIDNLRQLMSTLKNKQAHLRARYGRLVPLVVKISPDLSLDLLDSIAELLLSFDIEGVVATNASAQRQDLAITSDLASGERGGLSGVPIRDRSTDLVRSLARRFNGKIPIIGLGGIFSAQDALEKLKAGASLVQVMTGLVYRGPQLISEIVNTLHANE